jgi:type III secretion system HrpE/YscL family protein
LAKLIKGGPRPSPPYESSVRPSAPSTIAPPAKSGPPKIIEREVVGAHHEARKLISDAHQEAQQIREAALAEAEETRQRGYQEGYQEGLGQYTEQTTRALLELEKKEQALELEFVKLVRVCVEKLLGQEMKLHPDAIVGIVRNALRDARQQREIIVRINPEDVEQAKKSQGRLLEVLARANAIEIRADNAITRGGCVIMTELGTIDASLERQLQALEDAIEEEVQEGGGGRKLGGSGYGDDEDELDQEDDPGSGGY